MGGLFCCLVEVINVSRLVHMKGGAYVLLRFHSELTIYELIWVTHVGVIVVRYIFDLWLWHVCVLANS
jgi:hypothetical protein